MILWTYKKWSSYFGRVTRWLNKNKLKKFSLNALLNFGENNNNRYYTRIY